MNILVIGNGFDLAHDLPTSYSDFLKFLQCIEHTKFYTNTLDDFLKEHVYDKQLNAYVINFIIDAFNNREAISGEKYTNKNFHVQKLYNESGNNIWYQYLLYAYETGYMKGINWIDFESEISFIIEHIDKAHKNIYSPFEITTLDNNQKVHAFSQIALTFLNMYLKEKGKSEKYQATYYDFIEKSYLYLQRLVKCLEIYLEECVEKIPIKKLSPDIKGTDIHAVLNFNYTHTYANNYMENKIPIHYLHGETRILQNLENNMVLGIDEYHDKYERDIYTDYNIYKKFTQRIIKETVFLYRDWIKFNDENYQRYSSKIKDYHVDLFVFGHSLDVTDKDILKDLIDRPGVRTTIFYHDKQQQTQQIANLVKMLGQEHFIEMINQVPPLIQFQPQKEMEPISSN